MRLLSDLITLYILVLLVRGVMSFFVPAGLRGGWADVYRVVCVLTEPVLAPARRLIHPVHMGGGQSLDLSFTVVVILLYVVRSLL